MIRAAVFNSAIEAAGLNAVPSVEARSPELAGIIVISGA
jgi:hypothetical protein